MKIPLLTLLSLVQVAAFCQAADGPAELYIGQWTGEAQTQAERTRLSLHINSTGSGLSAKMTLVDVGVMSWPAKRVKQVAGGIEAVFPSDSGDQVMRFSQVAGPSEEQQLKGTWSDNRFKEAAIVALTKAADEGLPAERIENIEGPAGRLSTAVTLPVEEGPHPGVVFLHGSGPQPKDTSRFAAHALAKHGIASLIFDKRGVGKSEGQLAGASFDDLAADGVAAAKYLLSLPEVSSVGFFGHSQGGWIGPLAGAQWSETAFVISSAGPVVPPSREAHWGFIRKMRASGINEDDVGKARQIIEYWHDGIRTGDWTVLDGAIQAARSQAWFENSGLDYFSNRPDKAFVNNYRVSMDYEPVPTLRRLKAPLLAILTPDDESIDARETEGILRGLIRVGNDIHIKLYPRFGHSMRRIGEKNQLLRWPGHPEDYFSVQADFIREIVLAGDER
jgi:alpha/beta superfamily hydrolase